MRIIKPDGEFLAKCLKAIGGVHEAKKGYQIDYIIETIEAVKSGKMADDSAVEFVSNGYGVRDIVRDAELLLTELAKRKGMSLKSEIDPRLRDVKINDSTAFIALMGVVREPVHDSIKYSPKGSVITISVRLDEDSKNVVFEVVDQGFGISRLNLWFINKGDYGGNIREHTELEGVRTDGSGFGLMGVKGRVDSLGGELKITSKHYEESPGENGTTVSVTIPAEHFSGLPK